MGLSVCLLSPFCLHFLSVALILQPKTCFQKVQIAMGFGRVNLMKPKYQYGYVCSCGSVVEHCVSRAKDCGFNSHGTHIWTKKCIAWMHCKLLWIKASDKCQNYWFLLLHHFLINGSSAVNGCRHNESPNSWYKHHNNPQVIHTMWSEKLHVFKKQIHH